MRLCIAAELVAAKPCCWLQISLLLAVRSQGLVETAVICGQQPGAGRAKKCAELVAAAPGGSLLLAVRSQLLVEAAIVLKLFLGQIHTVRIIILYSVLKY